MQSSRIMPTLDRIAWPLAAVLLALGSYLLIDRLFIQPGWWPKNNIDMSVYLNAAKALSEGKSMYDPSHYPTDVYGYPPFFAEFIAVGRMVLGEGREWIVWVVFSIAALFASLAILMRGFGHRTPWKWVVLLFSVFSIGHITRTDLYHMQPHFALLLLIVLGLRYHTTNRPIAGGLAWAVVFVCKPFTGALVFWLMRCGNWRSVFTTLTAATVLFIGSFLPFLPDMWSGFKGWLSASSFHTGWPNVAKSANETFYGLFNRLFGPETKFAAPWVEMPSIIPYLMAPFVVIAAVGIYLSAGGRSRTAAIPPEEWAAQSMVQSATVLGFAMSCGPLMETPHCFMVLPGLIGVVLLAQRRWRENAATKWRWMAAAIAWSATMFWLACPVPLPIVNLYLLGQITGPLLLITVKMSLFLLASCLLTTVALIGDRRAQRATQDGDRAAANPDGRRVLA